jgi:ubiquinone biosynthesis protein
MPRLTPWASTFRRFKRSRQIVGILVKYGFGQLMEQIRAWEHINIECRVFHRCDRRVANLEFGERIRLAVQELGPTFIKMGQMLSTRPDMVPPDIIKELEKLQDRVPSFPSPIARKIVEAELHRPIEEVFASFDDEPIAAASLSQVHRAKLKGGQEVVAKIRRPGIVETIEADMGIMRWLAGIMEHRVAEARFLNVVGLVEELHTNIKKELDFRTEANNIIRYADNFYGRSNGHQLKIPHVYEALSTSKLLVLEYIEGINISKTDQLVAEGYDLKLIARRLSNILFKSILEHGFFHADPHPGNVFVLPDNVICLLDFGMMGTLSAVEKTNVAGIVIGIATRDEKVTTRALLDLASTQDRLDEQQFQMDVSRHLQRYAYVPLNRLRLGEMLQDELRLITTHHLRFPTNLVWVTKAIATVENITSHLDPQINMVEYVRPFAEEILSYKFHPLKEARELGTAAIEFLDLLKDLPYELRSAIRRIREGRVRLEIEQVGQEATRKTVNRVTNRLAIAMIIAALLVASSLLVASKLPPLISSVSIIGISGFAIAAILGSFLVFSALRAYNR